MQLKDLDLRSYAIFNSQTFIFRCISFLFSVIIYGCISECGYLFGICIIDDNHMSCGFGVSVALISIILCILFSISDFVIEKFELKFRQIITLTDTIINAIWTFVFFICFCYIANHWYKTNVTKILIILNINSIRAAITFIFLSILSWAGLTYVAYLRHSDTTGSLSYNDQTASDQEDYSRFHHPSTFINDYPIYNPAIEDYGDSDLRGYKVADADPLTA